MKNEQNKATDSDRPRTLSYAGPRQPDEEVPPRKKRLSAITMSDAILAALVLGVLVDMLIPAVSRRSPHRNYASLASQSNLNAIHHALQHYANDNGMRFPPSFAELIGKRGPFTNAAMFVDRMGSATTAPGETVEEMRANLLDPTNQHCSYLFAVPGWSMRTIRPDTVIAHERPEGHTRPTLAFLFGDGSTRALTRAEAANLMAKLAAGENRTKPSRGPLNATTTSSR